MTSRAVRLTLAAGFLAAATAPFTQPAAASCSPRLLVVCAVRYRVCQTVEPYAPESPLCPVQP